MSPPLRPVQDLPPSPSPGPSAEPAASSPASAKASRTSNGGLVGDAGPAFDARAAAAQPAPEPAADALALEIAWDAERVKVVLRAEGAVAHNLLAVDRDSGEWVWTEPELAAVAPALANMLNANPLTRAAAASSDPIALIMGLSGHVSRSIGERRAALAARDQGPQPITGLAPEPLTTDLPEEDLIWTTGQ